MLGVDDLIARGAARHGYLAGSREPRMTLHPVHLVLAKKELDAARVFGHHRVHVFQNAAHLERESLHLDALLAGFLRVLVKLGGVKQRLGGDAPAKGAGAPQARVAVDAHHLQAMLPGTDRGHIPARSSTDNRHIVDSHVLLLSLAVALVLSDAKDELAATKSTSTSAKNPGGAPIQDG